MRMAITLAASEETDQADRAGRNLEPSVVGNYLVARPHVIFARAHSLWGRGYAHDQKSTMPDVNRRISVRPDVYGRQA